MKKLLRKLPRLIYRKYYLEWRNFGITHFNYPNSNYIMIDFCRTRIIIGIKDKIDFH